MVTLLKKPCIGIGGITLKNAREVMQQGATGIAVVSGIGDAENPKKAAEGYQKCIKNIIGV